MVSGRTLLVLDWDTMAQATGYPEPPSPQTSIYFLVIIVNYISRDDWSQTFIFYKSFKAFELMFLKVEFAQ